MYAAGERSGWVSKNYKFGEFEDGFILSEEEFSESLALGVWDFYPFFFFFCLCFSFLLGFGWTSLPGKFTTTEMRSAKSRWVILFEHYIQICTILRYATLRERLALFHVGLL